jgi:hypothetical protein
MDFRTFRRTHPGFLAAIAIVITALLAMDGWIIYKRIKYSREIDRLRAGMTDAERRRSDLIVESEGRRLEIMVALIRRQALGDKEIHLSVSIDSATMYLEREGVSLREMPIEIGPEKTVGIGADTVRMTIPRGTRTVQRVLSGDDGWEVPAWVYADRGLSIPEDRAVKGALGPVAILLEGGTVIYSLPSAGPLNDSTYVMPGAVRARTEDLRAIAPNVQRGATVYFF